MKPAINIYVIGATGSGKSTTARQLAAAFGLRYVDIDRFWRELGGHQHRLAGHHTYVESTIWPKLQTAVAAATREPGWVVDGNYAVVRDDLLQRADRIVFLRVPFRRRFWNNLKRELRGESRRNGYARGDALPFFGRMIKRGGAVDRELAELLKEYAAKTVTVSQAAAAESALRRAETPSD